MLWCVPWAGPNQRDGAVCSLHQGAGGMLNVGDFQQLGSGVQVRNGHRAGLPGQGHPALLVRVVLLSQACWHSALRTRLLQWSWWGRRGFKSSLI